jgi:hypothetical protein
MHRKHNFIFVNYVFHLILTLAGGGHYHILMKKKYDCGRKISNIKK